MQKDKQEVTTEPEVSINAEVSEITCDGSPDLAGLLELIKLQRSELLAMLILTQNMLIDQKVVSKEMVDRYVNEQSVNAVADGISRVLEGRDMPPGV